MGIKLIKKTAYREDAAPVENVAKDLEKKINAKFGSQIVGAFTRDGNYPGVSVALSPDDTLKQDDIESVGSLVEEYNKTAETQLGAKESGGESLFGTNATTWDNLVSKSNPDGMALTVYVNLNAIPEKNAEEASWRFVKLVGACLEKVGKGVAETNEAVYKAIKNPGQAAFLIDCGTPEKAKELNDAFYAVAFKDDGWRPNKEVIGGEVVQGWNVGQYFTACVDPCDKAIEWCENWLRNSDGKAPGIQGNSAGLESKAREDDVGARLCGILNRNSVWSEVSGGDNDSLVDQILDGDWIGLMCGPDSDEAADWDAYIKDTFGPFRQYVAAEWFSPDKNDPDFKTVRIQFKPRFTRGDKETQASVLNRLGAKIADGYFVEGKRNEALSPKMQQRMKVSAWQEATDKMKGFDEAGHTLLDMIGKDGKYLTIFLPIEGMATEAEAREAAKKIFGDFEDYINFGADFDDIEEVWYPYYGLKKEFFGLTKEEGLAVLKEFDDVLYKAITRGIKAFK